MLNQGKGPGLQADIPNYRTSKVTSFPGFYIFFTPTFYENDHSGKGHITTVSPELGASGGQSRRSYTCTLSGQEFTIALQPSMSAAKTKTMASLVSRSCLDDRHGRIIGIVSR